MGNRHHNKKLRAAVRAAMASNGESYQRALCRLRPQRATVAPSHPADLIPIEYFGVPLTLATFEIFDSLACVFTSARHLSGPMPKSPLLALGSGATRAEPS